MSEALTEILDARTAEDLFGTATSNVGKARLKYRRLLRVSHPDMFSSPSDKQRAGDAFIKLTELWDIYTGKKSATKAPIKENTIKTKKHEYTAVVRTEDDVFQIFNATYDAGHKKAEVLIAKNADDKDLIDAYLGALDTITHDTPDEYKKFFPTLIEKFNYVGADNVSRPSIAIEDWDGFYSLREVLEKYPEGLGPRHVSWIFRRMLVAIGNAADIGRVHGAPNLDAFYINPHNHGIFLRSWQYSVKTGENLVAVPQNTKADYPEYVFKKKPVDYKLDVWIAAKTAIALMGNQPFKPYSAFFKGCMLTSVPHPAELLAEFDALMDKSFGERKFVTFDM
jgi:hypothetical protein